MPKRKRAKHIDIKKEENLKHENVKEKNLPATENAALKFINERKYLLLSLVILIVALVVFFVKSWLLVAMVNGTPLTRPALISELEKRGAQQTLDSMITKTLIMQEASKKNITASDKDVNDEINKIKDDLSKQGQKIDDVLKMQGMTQNDLRDQVRIQKVIEKILGDKIKVSDKEVDDFIKQRNSASETKTEPTQAEKDQAKEQLKQQKLSTEYETWMKDLKSKSKINYFATF